MTRSRVCRNFVLRTSFPNSLSHVQAFHPPSVVSFRKTKKTILDIFSSSFSSSSRVYAQCKQERRRRDAGRPCVGLTLSLVVAWRGEGRRSYVRSQGGGGRRKGLPTFFFFCYLIWCRRQRRELRKAAGQTRPTDRQRTRGRMKGGGFVPPKQEPRDRRQKQGFFFFASGAIANPTPRRPKGKRPVCSSCATHSTRLWRRPFYNASISLLMFPFLTAKQKR